MDTQPRAKIDWCLAEAMTGLDDAVQSLERAERLANEAGDHRERDVSRVLNNTRSTRMQITRDIELD